MPEVGLEPPPIPPELLDDAPLPPITGVARPAPQTLKPGYAALALGYELILFILVCGGLGFALDYFLASGRTWTTIGLIAGVVGGMVRFVRSALKAAAADTARLRKPEEPPQ
jgi:F0F1-type ATP synthase assembly protein I